jgi:hypothetical protein
MVMDIFSNFDFYNFFRSLIGGFALGAILSTGIRANIRSQNKYFLNPTSANNWSQGITYFASLLIGCPLMILIILKLLENRYHDSGYAVLPIFLPVLFVVVLAFKYKWIPDRLSDEKETKH